MFAAVSDRSGHRPLLLAALLVAASSTAGFLLADRNGLFSSLVPSFLRERLPTKGATRSSC